MDEDGINWIKIGDTDPSGKYIYTTSEKIKPAGLKKSRYVEAGDFLLSNSMSFGRPYILQTNGCIHDGWLVLKNYQKSLYLDFFYYLLLSPNVQKQFEIEAKGSTVRNLNTEIVSNINVSYPPLEEQKRIVKILDEKTAQLETIKTNAQTNLQNAKDLFQSQLTRAFSNTTWEKKRLEEVCSRIFAGGDKPQIVSKEISKTCQIPIFANAITDDGLYGYTNEATVFDKCLTISARGTIGFTCIRNKPFVPIVRLLVLIPKDEINISYLKYGCDTLTITNTGSSIPQLTVPTIKDYKIPLPPLSEQKHIVKELDTLSEKVCQLQEIYTKQIANCDELKQAYLQKAFEGEL